jgi:hypothetical protein
LTEDQVSIIEEALRFLPMRRGTPRIKASMIILGDIPDLLGGVDRDLEGIIGIDDLRWEAISMEEEASEIENSPPLTGSDLTTPGTIETTDLLTREVGILMGLLIGTEGTRPEETVVIGTTHETISKGASPQRGAATTEIEEGAMIIDLPIEEAETLVVTKGEGIFNEKNLEEGLLSTINQLSSGVISEKRINEISNLANRQVEQVVILQQAK